jgi:hypothetical protein
MAWLAARCPVSAKAQGWIEDSLQWLREEFGGAALNGEVVQPGSMFPPGSYSGTEADLHVALRRLCTRMSVKLDAIRVDLSDDPDVPELGPRVPIVSQFSGAAGHFQRDGDMFVVAVRRRQLRDQVALTATLAHELAHARLLGEQRIDPGRKDQEQLTDLTTVFFGLGVFTANAAFDFSQSEFGWKTSQLGYLGEALFGYALAYYAHLRGEEDPPWARALDTNPRVYMHKGLRFLRSDRRHVDR